ncbi:hypothetical protein R2601_09612 [Salipiger bermudensis HTCC2601]|uniref:Uncharacterized protein n=1 Tax=Salipiger bermudensis (strain DSM 26914 / JCM 13377 / KCTC 12554 / HTCC2601) TaxID=314265 RepID=Q0FIF6_SALBH|nr:hypothetical protein R2601_09612 [Salipiger bermudensis HTCC2601]
MPATPNRCSLPLVVEAYRDALVFRRVGRHLVTQPRLPEQHITHRRCLVDEGLQLLAAALAARRRSHHEAQPRILELQRRGAVGHRDIGRSRDHRMRVDMRAVRAALGQDVDPNILDHQLLVAEIEFQILGESRHMPVERLDQSRKDWKAPRQVGQRGIGGVARVVVLVAPFLPRLVILGDGPARGLELVEIDGRRLLGERGAVEAGREERTDLGHAPLIARVAETGERQAIVKSSLPC